MKYLIDLDGTLLNGKSKNIDAIEFVDALLSKGTDYRIITNSIASPASTAQRLNDAGILVSEKFIINPMVAINSYLRTKKIRSAFIVGSESESRQICIKHTEENPEIVILLDFEKINASYEFLQKLLDLVERGLPTISASASKFYNFEGKRRIDTGAYVLMLEAISSRKIAIFGKPSSSYFSEGLNLLGSQAEEVTVIGDDWSTDVVGGKSVGCRTVLVRSGKYCPGDENLGSPDYTVNMLMEVIKKEERSNI